MKTEEIQENPQQVNDAIRSMNEELRETNAANRMFSRISIISVIFSLLAIAFCFYQDRDKIIAAIEKSRKSDTVHPGYQNSEAHK